MTRNLTYLGNPFEEGKGTAQILENNDSIFQQNMAKLADQKTAKLAADEKKKKESQKALDDWDINYWLNHQSYFQDKAKKIYDQGVDLLAKGYDLNDKTNKQVAQWYKDQYGLKKEAELSTGFGKLGDALKNMTPDQRSKYTPQSLEEAQSFYFGNGTDTPDFIRQMEAIKSGTEPQLKVKVEVPNEEAIKYVNAYNAKIPTLMYGADPVEQEKIKTKAADDYAKYLTHITEKDQESMFWNADDPKAARTAWIEAQKALFKESVDDLAKKADDKRMADQNAIQDRHNKATEYLKSQDQEITKQNNMVQGANTEEWAAALFSGEKDALLRAAEDGYFNNTKLTSKSDGTQEEVVEEVVKPTYMTGAELKKINPNNPVNEGSTYLVLNRYDTDGKTRITKEDGHPAFVKMYELYDENGEVKAENMAQVIAEAQNGMSMAIVKNKKLPYKAVVPIGTKAIVAGNFGTGTETKAPPNTTKKKTWNAKTMKWE